MIEKPWYKLNIDVSDAISDLGFATIKNWINSVPEEIPGGYWKLYLDNGLLNFFNPTFLQTMENKGMPVDMFVSFYRKPYYCHPTAHIDGSLTRSPIFGLNWVVGSTANDSDMVWYEMPKIKIPTTTTEYGTAQIDIDTTDLAEIGRAQIGQELTLVRVDVPHNIVMRSHHRFVVSLRCRLREFQSWDDAVKYFEPYIKE